MNVDEAVAYLEQLESDEEGVTSAEVFILPPENNDNFTDEDSGDEASCNLDNLSRNQLLAPALLKVCCFFRFYELLNLRFLMLFRSIIRQMEQKL